MTDDVRARLRAVFVEALALDGGIDVERLAFRDVPAWDSVGHMALVAAIEDEFGVQLDTAQVIDLSSFTSALDLLADRHALVGE
ncbi:MAG TPA: acyl carrier protein [Pseudonocardiaceae bacterium]|nr:acyl carrier protein [Pseudonocardiaceae bacterium]